MADVSASSPLPVAIVQPVHAPKFAHARRFAVSMHRLRGAAAGCKACERYDWFPVFSSTDDLNTFVHECGSKNRSYLVSDGAWQPITVTPDRRHPVETLNMV